MTCNQSQPPMNCLSIRQMSASNTTQGYLRRGPIAPPHTDSQLMTFDCHSTKADQGFTGSRLRKGKQSSCKRHLRLAVAAPESLTTDG